MNRPIILFLFAVAFTLVSCMDGETHDVRLESYDWISDDTLNASYIMLDGNMIQQSFRCSFIDNAYDFSSSRFLLFSTKSVRRQILYQEWESSYGRYFSIQITAGTEPFGDALTVGLNDVEFSYDLSKNEIISLSTPFGSKSKTKSGDSYISDDPILSEVEIMGTLPVGELTYNDVMHFSLGDFESEWTPVTITDIYVAKHLGLVRFALSNGAHFDRL